MSIIQRRNIWLGEKSCRIVGLHNAIPEPTADLTLYVTRIYLGRSNLSFFESALASCCEHQFVEKTCIAGHLRLEEQYSSQPIFIACNWPVGTWSRFPCTSASKRIHHLGFKTERNSSSQNISCLHSNSVKRMGATSFREEFHSV